MPGHRWNDTEDRLLLLQIIKLTSPQNLDWNKIAASMGENFTGSAVS